MTAAVLTPPSVVIPPPAPNSPDGDLIRLCTEYGALAIERDRILLMPADVSFVAVVSRLAELAPAIIAMPAHTNEGVQAKAVTMLHQDGAEAVPALVHTSPDAALIVLCTRHDAFLIEASADSALSGEEEDKRVNGLVDQAGTVAQAIGTMRATTDAGIAALAMSTAVYGEGLWIDSENTDLLKMLLRDSLALAKSRAATPSWPMQSDAGLIAACAAFDALEHRANAILAEQKQTPEDERAADALLDQLHAEQEPFFEQIMALPATTFAGIQAKVQSLTVEDQEILNDGPGDRAACLITSICRDVLGGALSPSVRIATPAADTELLVVHDRFIKLEGQCRGLQLSIPNDETRAAARDPLEREQNKIMNRAWELTATTLDGHRARARMLLAWDSEMKNSATRREGTDAEMAWLLVRDLLGDDHADALQSSDGAVYDQAIKAALTGTIPAPVAPEPVLALIAEANRLRMEVDAFCWDKSSDAEFNDLCIRARDAVLAAAAAPTTSKAGLKALAQMLLDDNASPSGSEGFDHSTAENAALILLKRLAADPVPPDPDTSIIALCDHATAAERDYRQLSDQMDALPLAEEMAFDQKEVQPAYDRACDAYDRIVQAPLPQTAEGLRAAARAAIFHGSDPRLPGPHEVDTASVGSELAWKLVGHIAGLEVRAIPEAAA